MIDRATEKWMGHRMQFVHTTHKPNMMIVTTLYDNNSGKYCVSKRPEILLEII